MTDPKLALPAHQERTEPTDPPEGHDDRQFIERRWREGVREAEYCARCCSLDPTPIANPYDPTSLAGTWWLRGYESMRAILRQSEEPTAPARAAEWLDTLNEMIADFDAALSTPRVASKLELCATCGVIRVTDGRLNRALLVLTLQRLRSLRAKSVTPTAARAAEWQPLDVNGRPKLFPIMCDERVAGHKAWIPWEVIAPHEAQAKHFHSQTLEELARRGGLAPCEAVAVIEDRNWKQMPQPDARCRLAELVAEFYRKLLPPCALTGMSNSKT